MHAFTVGAAARLHLPALGEGCYQVETLRVVSRDFMTAFGHLERVSLGSCRRAMFEDISVLTAGTVISDEVGLQLESAFTSRRD